MAQHKTSENAASSAIIQPCYQIQLEIDTKNDQLSIWQNRLEAHLSDESGEVSEGEGIRNNIRDINARLSVLKAEQRRLGCIPNGSSELPQDNQTVISTSAVRRKDAKALEILGNFYNTNTQKKK